MFTIVSSQKTGKVHAVFNDCVVDKDFFQVYTLVN